MGSAASKSRKLSAKHALVSPPFGQGLMFDNFLPCRFKAINEQALRSLNSYRDHLGITHPEFDIMLVLAENTPNSKEDISSKDLCKITGVDKATITRALDRLEDKALISRARNKKDSRLVKLKLTAKGRRIHEQIEENALEWEEDYLKSVSVEELNALHATLDKLSANLEAMDGYE